MSRGLIIDIIFNQEDEWDVNTIIDQLRRDYRINVSVDDVEAVIVELEGKGLLSCDNDDDYSEAYCGGVVL